MKPKLDWAHSKLMELDTRRKQLPDYPESVPLMVTGIYDLIRHQRNDLGHPRDLPPRLERGRVESHLMLFSEYYRGAEELRAFLVGHKASL
jgi:hypothetical protein